MKPFESFLRPQLEEYMVYRKNLGYAQKPTPAHLRAFDRYLKQTKPQPCALDPPFFLEMRANLTQQPASINAILTATRGFFQYLVRKGIYAENPLQDISRVQANPFFPFLFSRQQTDQLLATACNRLRKSPSLYLRDLSIYLAIVLLARCGLRISEPVRLLVNHYRYDDKTLYIKKTKFKKDRLIPVPLPVAAEVENYLSARKVLLSGRSSPYLLVTRNLKPLTDDKVRRTFHQAVRDIGLYRPRRIIANAIFASPTPHSLRHSFAVNTLKSIRERGQCPQNALPILAAYMGHRSYIHTTQYLKFLDAKHRQHFIDFSLTQQEQ